VKKQRKPKFVLKQNIIRPAKKPIFKDEITWNRYMKLKFPKRVKFNLDSDRDGVPDHKDCKPFDKKRQHFQTTGNSIKVSIIVPGTVNRGEEISEREHDERIAEVEKLLSGVFGGATTYTRGVGSWIDKKGLVRENVAITTSYTDPATFKKYEKYLHRQIKERQMWWGQDAIAVEIQDLQSPTNKKSGMHFLSMSGKETQNWILSQQ